MKFVARALLAVAALVALALLAFAANVAAGMRAHARSRERSPAAAYAHPFRFCATTGAFRT